MKLNKIIASHTKYMEYASFMDSAMGNKKSIGIHPFIVDTKGDFLYLTKRNTLIGFDILIY